MPYLTRYGWLAVTLILLFGSPLNAQKQGRFDTLYTQPVEYSFENLEHDLCVLDSKGSILFCTFSSANKKVKINQSEVVSWVGLVSDISTLLEKYEVKRLSVASRVYRDTALSRPFQSSFIVSACFTFLVVGLALLRWIFRDAFYTFVVPVSLYSTTMERITQSSREAMVMSVTFFCLLVYSFYAVYTNSLNIKPFFVIAIVVTIKLFAINRVNSIFEDRSFERLHLLEFLRFGTLPLILLFTLLCMEKNKLFSFHLDYLWFVIPCFLVWLTRLYVIFTKRYRYNILYFFSYLCATELIPLLALVFF